MCLGRERKSPTLLRESIRTRGRIVPFRQRTIPIPIQWENTFPTHDYTVPDLSSTPPSPAAPCAPRRPRALSSPQSPEQPSAATAARRPARRIRERRLTERDISREEARGLRSAKELEGHLGWLDSFTPAALGVLAVASGIYTYLGVSSLLDGDGALTFLAAVAYSLAVSVGIFVFWSYLLRLLPAMRTAGGFLGLGLATVVGSLAIVAMSSWLNAAALAPTMFTGTFTPCFTGSNCLQTLRA